jgi:hypothetical protein
MGRHIIFARGRIKLEPIRGADLTTKFLSEEGECLFAGHGSPIFIASHIPERQNLLESVNDMLTWMVRVQKLFKRFQIFSGHTKTEKQSPRPLHYLTPYDTKYRPQCTGTPLHKRKSTAPLIEHPWLSCKERIPL